METAIDSSQKIENNTVSQVILIHCRTTFSVANEHGLWRFCWTAGSTVSSCQIQEGGGRP